MGRFKKDDLVPVTIEGGSDEEKVVIGRIKRQRFKWMQVKSRSKRGSAAHREACEMLKGCDWFLEAIEATKRAQ